MKPLFTVLIALVTVTTFAQKDFQGKATYMSKTTMDMSRFGDRFNKMSEAQKKQMAARMKSFLEKTFILTFDKSSSIYKEDEKLAAPTAGGGRGWGSMTGSGVKYKNTKDLVALESIEFFGKKFLISDEMKRPEWELGSETKKIGEYVCYKATLTKDVDPTDWTNMRRRRNNDDNKKKDETKKDTTNVVKISDEIEMPKQITVTAWYTPQIPISNGPGEYWGLPGLILELNSGRTTILCTEIVINPEDKVTIEAPSKGTEVTREEYNQIITKKMEEMREMYRNRRRRN
ncbi:GLPGLI family protein [Polaribacter batillariae]|uniref:GLPGLI family protein n=1 Tax=Polaribacter batillariae TaxID=2808900 RepID=A0ABX7SZ57_9FLAO|nr:GLPGLI family protein [Polaribacter batillariae]QTD38989.1 GLPGLI family protein [Polaribacter batillariae]